ncbi:MAG TPA: glycosyltransferase family 4 protein [Bacteroidales bacterium]|nr:glycosyltransferase family 4 protein [Bacteroidales bacterium]HNZ43561.1 glycosyltransferase family 4 protein [Bacteroidales bacterium]HOH83308.1 glycosyltransferase family 4 protein [Bacteroidales bacterium]HPI31304.1 glycosyltransferase family 4 protein [Bacteroidales bacterium]
MFGWEFPPHITGGLGTACFGLTKGLLKNGVEVLFVVPKSYGDEDQQAVRLINASDVRIDFTNKMYQEYWKQLTYIEIGSNLIPYVGEEEFQKMTAVNTIDKTEEHSSVFSQQYTFSGKYGKNLMEEVTRYALVASTLAGSQQFDVIHAHDWLTYPAGIAAKKISGKPLVVHMHATEFDRSGDHINQNVYDIERKGMEIADAVITVSNFTRDIVINKYGINPDKVFTVHNAVEHNTGDSDLVIERNVKEKVVTFLGRITFQKGPDYFVEAAKRVLDKDKNVRFVMAGSGDMLNRMILRVAQLGISTHFHFTGFLQGAEVDKMFLLSDVYVMPSVSEPFGISPLEAMRSNVPVVISKQSGVSEVLKYALKIDFWDIDAMADAIYGLLHYDALSVMFRKYGKEEVENLKWESASSKIRDVYNKVIFKN